MTFVTPRTGLAGAALIVAFWAGHRFPAAEAAYSATRAAWNGETPPAAADDPWANGSASSYDPAVAAAAPDAPWAPVARPPRPGDVVFAAPYQRARAPARWRSGQQVALADLGGWSLPPGPRPLPPEQALPKPATPVAAPGTAAALAFARASRAYDQLRAGNRLAATRLFQAALAGDPDAAQADTWTKQVRQLTRQWHGDAYYIVRANGDGTLALADRAVLGGGAIGGTVSYTQNPLAKRPFYAFGRVDAATNPVGVPDAQTAQAALGVGWRPLAGVSVSVERRFKLGALSSSAWAARLAAGASGAPGRIRWDAYAEGGFVGLPGADLFAAGQARAGYVLWGPLDAGAGVWGALQRTQYGKPDRIDVGPSLRLRIPHTPVSAQADWRFRMAGRAAPGSGPVATLSASF